MTGAVLRGALAVVAGAAAILVAGCGGGGGSPQAGPTDAAVALPPGTSVRVVASTEVATVVSTGAVKRAVVRDAVRDDATPAPGSSATPVAYLLGVPDPYVSAAPISFRVDSAVYLVLPTGAPFPSPAPQATWLQSGDAGTPDAEPNIDPADSIPPGLLGFFSSSPPKNPGTSHLTVSVAGAGSAQVAFISYRALGMICTQGGLYGGAYTQAISFDASGTAVPQPSGSSGDIAFSGNPCSGAIIGPPGYTLLAFPYGATQPFATTTPGTAFGGITSSVFSNQTTLIRADALSTALDEGGAAPADKIVFKTQDGRLVKLLALEEPLDAGGTYITGLYAFYAVSNADGVFAF